MKPRTTRIWSHGSIPLGAVLTDADADGGIRVIGSGGDPHPTLYQERLVDEYQTTNIITSIDMDVPTGNIVPNPALLPDGARRAPQNWQVVHGTPSWKRISELTGAGGAGLPVSSLLGGLVYPDHCLQRNTASDTDYTDLVCCLGSGNSNCTIRSSTFQVIPGTPYTLTLFVWVNPSTKDPAAARMTISMTSTDAAGNQTGSFTFPVQRRNISPSNPVPWVPWHWRPVSEQTGFPYGSPPVYVKKNYFGARRLVLSSQIVFPANSQFCTVQIAGEGLHDAVWIMAVVMTPTINRFYYREGLFNINTVPPATSGMTRGLTVPLNPTFCETPIHDLIHVSQKPRPTKSSWCWRVDLYQPGRVDVNVANFYSIPCFLSSGSWAVLPILQSDPSVYHASITKQLPGDYSGGTRSIPISKINETTVQSMQVVDDPACIPLRVGWYSDPVPVWRDVPYCLDSVLSIDQSQPYLDSSGPLAPFVQPEWWVEVVRGALSRCRIDARLILVVVQGLDAENNVTEEPFISPIFLPGVQNGSLLTDDQSFISPRNGSLIQFNNSSTVKARFGIQILQTQVKEGNTVYLHLPPPVHALHLFLQGYRLFPTGLSQSLAVSTPLVSGTLDEELTSSNWSGEVAQQYSGNPVWLPGWRYIRGSQGNPDRYTLEKQGVLLQYAGPSAPEKDSYVGRADSYEVPNNQYWWEEMVLSATIPFQAKGTVTQFMLNTRWRANPAAVARASQSMKSMVQNGDLVVQSRLVLHFWDRLENAVPVKVLDIPSSRVPSGSSEAHLISEFVNHSLWSTGNWSNFNSEGQWKDEQILLPGVEFFSDDLRNASYVTVTLYFRSVLLDNPGQTQRWGPLFQVGKFQVVQLSTSVRVSSSHLQVFWRGQKLERSVMKDTRPYLAGLHRSASGYLPLIIRPGLAAVPLRVESEDLNGVPGNEWLSQALSQLGVVPGDLVVLFYTVPETLSGVHLVTLPGGGRTPCRMITERCGISDGFANLQFPAHQMISVTSPGGHIWSFPAGSGNDWILEMPSTRVDISARIPQPLTEAVVQYLSPATFAIYTGYRHRSTRVDLLIRADQQSVIRVVEGNNIQTVPHWEALGLDGISILLNPSAVMKLESEFLPWHAQVWERNIVRRSDQDQPSLYHVRGVLPDLLVRSRNRAMNLGAVVAGASYGLDDILVLDLRKRGGGLQGAESFSAEERSRLWDVSDWDGSLTGGGYVVFRLPDYLLDVSDPRGGYTEETLRTIIEKYLPAGVQFDIEFFHPDGQ